MAKLRVLKGNEIIPYINQISEFRVKYFKEYPYLYSGSLAYEREYIEGYCKEAKSLLIILEDLSGRLLGFSTGIPLVSDSEIVREAAKSFTEAGFDSETFFYFGETILVPEERGKGNYSKIVRLREEEAIEMGFEGACFMAVNRAENHPQRPKEYQSIDSKFEHMGYSKTSIGVSFTYPTILPDGTVCDVEHLMVYWMKFFSNANVLAKK